MRNVSACCDINYEEFPQNEDKKDSQLLTLDRTGSRKSHSWNGSIIRSGGRPGHDPA